MIVIGGSENSARIQPTLRRILLPIILLCLLLAGCQDETPTPESTVTPTTTPTVAAPKVAEIVPQTPTPTASPTQADISTATPTATESVTPASPAQACVPPSGWVTYVVQAGDTLSGLGELVGAGIAELQEVNCLPGPLIVIGQRISLPAQPPVRPTPCGQPADWVSYQVRSGDTLSQLAAATGVSLEQVRLANCREGDLIVVGESLFLPFRPATVAERPTAQPRCASDFGCPGNTGDMPELVLDPGRPNLPGFVPCSDMTDSTSAERFVSIGNSSSVTTQAQQGGRVFFVACNFPADASLSVEINGPSPDPQLVVGSYMFSQGSFPLVEWPIRCDVQSGSYSVSIFDGQGNSAVRSLTVSPSPIQRILLIPQFVRAGDLAWVYLCNYPSLTEVDIDLYRLTPGEGTEEEKVTTRSVSIDETGQGVFVLESASNDEDGEYFLRDRSDQLRGTARLWIVR